MSVREEKILSLTNVDLSKKSTKELKAIFKEVLFDGVHGFCSSPYEEGQQPGDTLTEDQIRRRLKIIKPYTKWIRSKNYKALYKVDTFFFVYRRK